MRLSELAQQYPQQREDAAEIAAGGGEDDVDGVPLSALEPATARVSVAATPEFAFDDAEDA